MQQPMSANDQGKNVLKRERERAEKQGKIHHFIRWDREKQIQTFLAWLPQELIDAPGITWTELSPDVMGYCVRTTGQSPDAAALAVAAASMHGAIGVGGTSQAIMLKRVFALLRRLRSTTFMQCLADLQQEHIWFAWAEQQEKTASTRGLLAYYTSIATGHFPRYLRRLTQAEAQRMRRYAFPPPPRDLTKSYFPHQKLAEAQQAKRKDTTDILAPLYPVLRQLVRFRKQLAERILLTFREARRRVEVGEVTLPYHFQHVDTLPEVNRDARAVSDVCIQGREVTLRLILWDKRSWVEHHQDRYGEASIENA